MSKDLSSISAAVMRRDWWSPPHRFAYEWNTYDNTLPEYEARFRPWRGHLAPRDWQGKSPSDVGCATGRNSRWPMVYGAREGCAVDIDEHSLVTFHRNLRRLRTVRVVRSSAYSIPFADRFDLALPIGVLHELEDRLAARDRMLRVIKAGGRVLVWVWGREGNGAVLTFFDPLRRAVLCRLPITFVHRLSLVAADIVFLLLRFSFRPNPSLDLPARRRFLHTRSIVVDQRLPRIARFGPHEQTEELMRKAGPQEIWIAAVNGLSSSAIRARPGNTAQRFGCST